MTINERLHDLYSHWKAQLEPDGLEAPLLSPPGLVSVPDAYEQSSSRVAVVGQEDMGNQWSQKILDDYGYADATWEHSPIESWRDFIRHEDSVEGLMAGYRLFDFARHQPANYRSPFWALFRRFADYGAACTTNLDRSSWDGGAIDDGPPEVRAYLSASDTKQLLRDELDILAPTICLFVTGPHRDHLIEQTWPGVRFEPLSPDIPANQLCRLVGDGLPPSSFRTYHPGHLSRCNKGFYLDIVDRRIARSSDDRCWQVHRPPVDG